MVYDVMGIQWFMTFVVTPPQRFVENLMTMQKTDNFFGVVAVVFHEKSNSLCNYLKFGGDTMSQRWLL